MNKAIARYDPAADRLDWLMGTGQDRTHMVIVSGDQKRLFTTNVASATICILEQITVARRGGPPPGAPPPGAAGRAPTGRGSTTDWSVTVVPSAPVPKDLICLRTAGSSGWPTLRLAASRLSMPPRKS